MKNSPQPEFNDDLAHRLVYADMLMAKGDPLGTFMGQQCRLESMDPLDPELPTLVASTERLRADHAAQWLAPLFDILEVPEERRAAEAIDGPQRWEFSRGLVSRLALDIDTAGRVAGALARAQPIEGLTLLVRESIPEDRYKFPEVATWRFVGVEPDGWFTDYSVSHVLAWCFNRIESLSLAKCALGVDGCRMLANLPTTLGETFEGFVPPPPLPADQLRSLDLRGCRIGDDGLEILALAPTLSRLEAFDLTQNRLGPPSLEQLRKSPVLTQLTALSLAGNNDLGPQLGVLAGWAPLPNLRRLNIPQTTTAEALAALFPEPSPALRALVLTSNKQLGPQPELLARCAQHFTELDLGTAKVGDKGLATLVEAASVRSVTSLELNGCSLSDKAISALTSSGLERLTRLDLSSNKLSDASLERLAKWPGLRHVTYLRLSNNRKLGHSGYAALADSAYFDPAQLVVGKLADPNARALLDERFGARVVS